VSVLVLLDLLGPCFLVGHIFGRIGCFLNGCCYGRQCDPQDFLAFHFAEIPGFHFGAQLIDALMNVVALGLLLAIERKGLSLGRVFSLTLVLHGITRFIYEIWRAGTVAEVKLEVASSTYWGTLPITQAQAMAAVLIVAGAIGLVLFGKRTEQTSPTDGASLPV
jgi:phosphatidylglycerol:prolipoprotein diacylglycerol transferase